MQSDIKKTEGIEIWAVERKNGSKNAGDAHSAKPLPLHIGNTLPHIRTCTYLLPLFLPVEGGGGPQFHVSAYVLLKSCSKSVVFISQGSPLFDYRTNYPASPVHPSLLRPPSPSDQAVHGRNNIPP